MLALEKDALHVFGFPTYNGFDVYFYVLYCLPFVKLKLILYFK